ncbi:Uncharacterised protein [Mycobacteroides abscessus subsp. abscessus]|nr:Uncharacterised protein [Mycobacteroides abscessus subsp. abscessus]
MLPVACIRFFFDISACDNFLDRQAEFLRKLIVALIMRRNGHDGPGSIACKHIVGNPDRHFFAVNRVDGISAGKSGLQP